MSVCLSVCLSVCPSVRPSVHPWPLLLHQWVCDGRGSRYMLVHIRLSVCLSAPSHFCHSDGLLAKRLTGCDRCTHVACLLIR